MDERVMTFSNLVRESKHSNIGKFWEVLFAIIPVILLLVFRYKFDIMVLFLLFLPMIHHLFVNQYLSPKNKKYSGIVNIINNKYNGSLIAALKNEFSFQGLMVLFEYIFHYLSIYMLYMEKIFIVIVLIIFSILILVVKILFVTISVYRDTTDEYKKKFSYVGYILISFFIIMFLEIIILSLIFYNYIHFANIFFIFLGHLMGFVLYHVIEDLESQSIELIDFENYYEELMKIEGNTVISTYFSGLPKLLIESKYRLRFVNASVLALAGISFIIGVVLMNILNWETLDWISILFWILITGIITLLIILMIDNLSRIRNLLRMQIDNFMNAIKQFEINNQKYFDILNEE